MPARTRSGRGGQAGDFPAVKMHCSFRQDDHSEQCPHGGGLAGPVRADDHRDLSPFCRDVAAMEDIRAAIATPESGARKQAHARLPRVGVPRPR